MRGEQRSPFPVRQLNSSIGEERFVESVFEVKSELDSIPGGDPADSSAINGHTLPYINVWHFVCAICSPIASIAALIRIKQRARDTRTELDLNRIRGAELLPS